MSFHTFNHDQISSMSFNTKNATQGFLWDKFSLLPSSWILLSLINDSILFGVYKIVLHWMKETCMEWLGW